MAADLSASAIRKLVEFLRAEEVRVLWTDGNEGERAKVCSTKDWPNKGQMIEGAEFGAGLFTEHLKRKNPIAIAKASGLFVIDCDSQGDIDAIEALWLPDTFTVTSGRDEGGRHYYFRSPDGAEHHALSVEGGTVKAHKDKYFLLPLSLHPSGRRYVGKYRPIADLDQADYDRLLAMAGASEEETRETLASGGRIEPGGRHDHLVKTAGHLRRAGADEGTILAALRGINETAFTEPKSDSELRKIAADAAGWTSGIDEMLAMSRPRPKGENGHRFTRLSGIEEKAARFFDRPLLQAGTFHVVSGRKAAGKGTYLCDLAAKVTKGELGDRRNVLWVSSEDSPSMDLRPRLAVAGADIGRVLVMDAGWLQLPRDVEWLREQAREVGDVALVIIDPVGNHITGADSNAETAIRDAIGPLNELADELDAVVVGIRHLTEKEVKTELRSAVLGSSAWVQVPRVVVGIVEDDEEADLRHIRVVVGNRVPRGEDQLAFRIVGVEREGHELAVPRLTWLGTSDKDMDKLLQGQATRSSSAVARDAILDELAAAPGARMESNALDAVIAERTGLKASTIRSLRSRMAKDGLLRNVPEKNLSGQVAAWFVSLSLDAARNLAGPDRYSDEWSSESQSRTEVHSRSLPTTFSDLDKQPDSRSLDPVDKDLVLDGGWG